MDKFLNEARCLTRFNHMAGIVAVQDFFYENETAYIVMDYVGERNVKQEIRENGAMDAKEVLMLMRPILEALSRYIEPAWYTVTSARIISFLQRTIHLF